MLEERSRSMLSAAGAGSNAAPAEHAVASTVAVAAGGGGAAAPASTDKEYVELLASWEVRSDMHNCSFAATPFKGPILRRSSNS